MRESDFIEQNREKWAEFERLLESDSKDPDRLGDLFIQVTDDLSHANTFYPNRSVRAYLNGLAGRVYFSLYRSKPLNRDQFIHFWTEELPRLIYESRAEFRVAFLTFLLAIGVGVLSTYMEPSFPRTILGDGYVDMTLENIAKGDPMAVYKKDAPFGMMLGITGNNLMVTLVVFSMGAFFAIGTLGALLFNGVMVGAFQFFFMQQGLLRDSFLTIWMHGSTEIPAIVMAGAAGLVMGKGLVFPGTYSRNKAFQLSARRGIRILLGVLPLIFFAGFVESYITRFTEVPDILRGFFIAACFGGVFWYYVWYPVQKARQGFFDEPRPEYPTPDHADELDLTTIKTGGALLGDTVLYMTRNLRSVLTLGALLSTAFCLWSFAILEDEFYFGGEFLDSMEAIPQFFSEPELYGVQAFLLSVLAGVVLIPLGKRTGRIAPVSAAFYISRYVQWFLLFLVFARVFAMDGFLALLVILLMFPVVAVASYLLLQPGVWLGSALSRSLQLVFGQLGRALGLSLGTFFTGLVLFLLLDSTITSYLLQTLVETIAFSEEALDGLGMVLQTGLTLGVMYFLAAAFLVGGVFLYHTLEEITEAPSLTERIQQIQTPERLRGMLREK
jgi:uncharacterized membrane protein SpoIIM required for sporulation